jgi:hypothetical protein
MSRGNDWMAGTHEGLYNQAMETVNYLTGSVLARIGIAGVIFAPVLPKLQFGSGVYKHL